MVIAHLSRSKATLAGLMAGLFSIIAVVFTAAPAHAASTVQMDWTGTTSIHFSGTALQTPVDITGDFVGNVFGTPAGSQTFMAASNGPVAMSFGCKVSMTLDIYPDAAGTLDYSKGELVFTTSSPSTCSQATLQANISGLTHDPSTGTDNLSLMDAPIGSVDKRGPTNGTDDPNHQTVNVTAGMGPASDYTGLPATDVLALCAAQGSYANNIDFLITDCLAHQPNALSAPPLTSNNLGTIKDGKGPNGGDEQGWTGQFTKVKPGIYVVCSTNFKACELFTKDPGADANVYVTFGTTAGSVIPGNPPGQGDTQKVCTTGDGLAGALAWVLCPAVQLIATATQFFENNIIIPFMTISPLTTNVNNPIYILWQDIRNFANIGFILFFFIVIFSQATSIGISNYGIKRILPKMAFVVVGVNLSYFFVAFVIDAFNIFGAGISQLVMAALQQAGTTQLNSGTSAGTVRSIFTLGGAALVTIVATGGAAIGWFFSFLGLGLLVVVVVVVVLVVRQMGIIILVIISPFAILLYMLPNTEGYAKKWWKTLIQLLMMYPLIVLLFASGKIFGVIFQQPDFTFTGDGVSDDVAQAARVILQFFGYVVPLGAAPAMFMASGAITGRAYSWLHNKAVQPRTNQLKEDASHLVGEAKMRAARVPGIGVVAGHGMRQDYVREQRRRNLSREQEEYVAGAVGSSAWLRRQASGVSGQAGQTRAAAHAANVASKGRNEDIEAEMALLNDKMRDLGVDQKTFASAAGRYLEDPSNIANQTITGSNGKTFNFAKDASQLQRALLNSAASQGEVKAVEAARMNAGLDQTMVDDIIRRNDGKLKEKGGYHLATNFNLAAGRGLTGTAAQNKTEMQAQRILAMAQSGANSVAGMKAGILDDTAKALNDPAQAAAITAAMDRIMLAQTSGASDATELRRRLKKTMTDISTNPNTMARTEASKTVIDTIGNKII